MLTFAIVAAWLRSPLPFPVAVPFPGGPPGAGRDPAGREKVVAVRDADVDVEEGAVKFGGSSDARVLEIGNGLFLPWA